MADIDPGWLGAGTVIAAVVTSIGSFVAGQRHGKAAFITAVHDAAQLVIGNLRVEIERVQDHREHCERELALVKARQAEIDALMAGRVAQPGERPPE